jgi:hypothetical protein
MKRCDRRRRSIVVNLAKSAIYSIELSTFGPTHVDKNAGGWSERLGDRHGQIGVYSLGNVVLLISTPSHATE